MNRENDVIQATSKKLTQAAGRDDAEGQPRKSRPEMTMGRMLRGLDLRVIVGVKPTRSGNGLDVTPGPLAEHFPP